MSLPECLDPVPVPVPVPVAVGRKEERSGVCLGESRVGWCSSAYMIDVLTKQTIRGRSIGNQGLLLYATRFQTDLDWSFGGTKPPEYGGVNHCSKKSGVVGWDTVYKIAVKLGLDLERTSGSSARRGTSIISLVKDWQLSPCP